MARRFSLAVVACGAFGLPFALTGNPDFFGGILLASIPVASLATGEWSWPGARGFLFVLSFAVACVVVACGNFLDPIGAPIAFACIGTTAGITFVPTLARAVRDASLETTDDPAWYAVLCSTVRLWVAIVVLFGAPTVVSLSSGAGDVALLKAFAVGGVGVALLRRFAPQWPEFSSSAFADLLLGAVGLYASVACLT